MTCSDDDSNLEESTQYLCTKDESSEEKDKLDFICSCIIGSIKSGGSVLIPVDRIGVLLQLLEEISLFLKSSGLEVFGQNQHPLFPSITLSTCILID